MTRGPMSRFAANISIAQNRVVFVCLRPETNYHGPGAVLPWDSLDRAAGFSLRCDAAAAARPTKPGVVMGDVGRRADCH